jgi:hypothetical protein
MNDNSDRYSKTMGQDLKQIIQKANKEHFLEMKNE